MNHLKIIKHIIFKYAGFIEVVTEHFLKYMFRILTLALAPLCTVSYSCKCKSLISSCNAKTVSQCNAAMIVSLIYLFKFKEHPMPSQHNPLELNYDFHSEECNVVFASTD